MSYLFIDSTYDLILGILDDEFKWLSFEHTSGQKASVIIQAHSQKLLDKHKLDVKSLRGVITVNGPGFYTGLRLAEGLSDVFQFFGVKQFSFYTYDIPFWCGIQEGTWFTKAYRGEYFLYYWKDSTSSQKLVAVKDLHTVLTEELYYIHSELSLDQTSSAIIKKTEMTIDLLQKYPEKIFPNVLSSPRKDAFYFRAPEDEFKANP